MKIAIPTVNGMLCQHFGHSDQFAVLTVDTEKKTISTSQLMSPPPHEPGVLPRWLQEQGVTVVIAGGMGQRAQQLLREYGIEVLVGAPQGSPEQIVQTYLKGSLQTGDNLCDH